MLKQQQNCRLTSIKLSPNQSMPPSLNINKSLRHLYFEHPYKPYCQKAYSNYSGKSCKNQPTYIEKVYLKTKKPKSYQKQTIRMNINRNLHQMKSQILFQNQINAQQSDYRRKSLKSLKQKIEGTNEFYNLKKLLKNSYEKSNNVLKTFRHLNESTVSLFKQHQQQSNKYQQNKNLKNCRDIYKTILNNKKRNTKFSKLIKIKQQINNSTSNPQNNSKEQIIRRDDSFNRYGSNQIQISQNEQLHGFKNSFNQTSSIVNKKLYLDKFLQCTTHQVLNQQRLIKCQQSQLSKIDSIEQIIYKPDTIMDDKQIFMTPIKQKQLKMKQIRNKIIDNLQDLRTTQTKYAQQQEYKQSIDQSMIIYQGSVMQIQENPIQSSKLVSPKKQNNHSRRRKINTIQQEQNLSEIQSGLSLNSTQSNTKYIFQVVKRSDEYTLLAREINSQQLMALRLNCKQRSCMNVNFEKQMKECWHNILNYQYNHLNLTNFNEPICVFQPYQYTLIELIRGKLVTSKNMKSIYDQLVLILSQKYFHQKQQFRYNINFSQQRERNLNYELLDLFCCCSGNNFKIFNTRNIIHKSIEQNCGILMLQLCSLIRQVQRN